MTQTNHTDVVSFWITRESSLAVKKTTSELNRKHVTASGNVPCVINNEHISTQTLKHLSYWEWCDWWEYDREVLLWENSLCCCKPALHLKPSRLQNVMVCGGNWDLWFAALQTSVESASRRLRVFVFERPSWIFALVHHDGRNPIVCRHLTAVELRHKTERHSQSMNEWMNECLSRQVRVRGWLKTTSSSSYH